MTTALHTILRLLYNFSTHPWFWSDVRDDSLFDAILFRDERPLKDDPSFLVLLVLFSGKLVHPAELEAAVLAIYITNHVTAGKHHAVLHFTGIEKYNDLSDCEGNQVLGFSIGHSLDAVSISYINS